MKGADAVTKGLRGVDRKQCTSSHKEHLGNCASVIGSSFLPDPDDDIFAAAAQQMIELTVRVRVMSQIIIIFRYSNSIFKFQNKKMCTRNQTYCFDYNKQFKLF